MRVDQVLFGGSKRASIRSAAFMTDRAAHAGGAIEMKNGCSQPDAIKGMQ
jgi:hypothetical protein